jgi:hypothetical protein
MTGCLFCNNQIDDDTDLRVTLAFPIVTGATLSVTVDICDDCRRERRVTLAETIDLARRRHGRREIPDGTPAVKQQAWR